MAFDLQHALFDPASVFASPHDVLAHRALSRSQKIKILRCWEYDAAEEAVALEEGMPGREGDRLRPILLALGQAGDDIGAEHVGPSKHHGLPESVC